MAEEINRLIQVSPNPEGNKNINNEDLSIVVELETIKKSKSSISVKDGVSYFNNSGDKDGVIRFISGSMVNGKRSLTTEYTNIDGDYRDSKFLFENKSDLEWLGIESIDISFNSSYAPLIKINFIDLRGGALMEQGNDSPYNVFFNLPYPVFKLTVKGFYGQAVSYCLHLVNFDAKFNSSTGNFEIKTEFIGYTYAFLTDMLIGYLRSSVYTKEGLELLKQKQSTNPNIMSIDDLIFQFSSLDGFLSKLKQNNPVVKSLANIEDKIEKITTIQTFIDNFTISILDNIDDIIYSKDSNLFLLNNTNGGVVQKVTDFESTLNNLINDLNPELGDNYSLNTEKFKNIIKKNVSGSIRTFIDNSDKTDYIFIGDEIENDLNSESSTNYSEETQVIFIDLSFGNEEISDKLTQLSKLKDKYTEDVSNELMTQISNNIDVKPSIKNIFSIFSAHVDIFMQLIKNVKNKAKNDPDRISKFSKFKDNLDIRKEISGDNGNSNLPNTIYPFPGFSIDGVETWIGRYIPDLPEVKFIESLLRGFLKAGESNKVLETKLNFGDVNWYPVSVLDTKLVNDTNPFEEIKDVNTYNKVFDFILKRAITYLSFTNSRTSNNDIKITSTIEAESIKEFISDQNVLRALINVDGGDTSTKINNLLESYSNTTKDGDIFNFSTNTFFDLGENDGLLKYYYRDPIDLKNGSSVGNALPLDFYFDKSQYDSNYIKIYSLNEYNAINGYYPDYDILDNVNLEPDIIDLNSLYNNFSLDYDDINDNIPVMNRYSGTYKTQEFFNIRSLDNKVYSSDILFWSDLNDDRVDNKFISSKIGDSSKQIDYLNNGDVDFISRKFIGFEVFKDSNILDPTEFGVSYSLFGSELYFRQADNLNLYNNDFGKVVTNRSRALLFLHTLPFDGLVGSEGYGLLSNDSDKSGIYDGYLSKGKYIRSLFNKKGGFIKVPKYWLLLIGGLLWRKEGYENGTLVSDPIRFTDSNGKYFIYNDGDLELPTVNTYIKQKFSNLELSKNTYTLEPMNLSSDNYVDLEKIFVNLPTQVKTTLINQFIEWCDEDNSREVNWNDIRNIYEIEDLDSIDKFNYNSRILSRNSLINSIIPQISDLNEVGKTELIKNTLLSNGYSNLGFIENIDIKTDDYIGQYLNFDISYIDTSSNTYQLINIMKSISEPVVLANATWRIWGETNEDGEIEQSATYTQNLSVLKENLDTYLVNFLDTLVNKFKNESLGVETEEIKQDTFGTINNDVIKLNLYRTIKSIHDKWVGGTDTNKSITNCITGDEYDLIDTFKFLDKSFKDIGDEFLLNPKSIVKMVTGDNNQSFYDLISRLLTNNNFDFIPLPSYVNYRDEEQLSKIFEPIPYLEYVDSTTTSPSFICMYVGQTSKHLDLGDGDYKDDSINFDDISSIPKTFTNVKGENIPVFTVDYARGNQSIFKDLDLNQSEFSETDESLNIIDDIALQGDRNSRTYVGQNLFNTYSTRSYEIGVESMGNAMIQPMMYFQLNGVPMFKGGYLITKVSHKIKANSMMTNFKGVRVSQKGPPLIEAGSLYMDILGSLNNVDVSGVKIIDYLDNSELLNEARNVEPSIINSLDFGLPCDDPITITSPLGYRNHPTRGKYLFHKGIDIGITTGTNLYALQDGVVELARINNDGYGLYIIVRHNVNGVIWRVLYAHLNNINSSIIDLDNLTESQKSQLNNSELPLNITVNKGDIIAESGGNPKSKKNINGGFFRGTSTGDHLHLEVRQEKSPETEAIRSAYFYNSIIRDPAQLIGLTRYGKNINTIKEL